VIGTESYFEDAICFCQAEIAKELNNPSGYYSKMA
jgi:hypothetical protein